MGTVYSRRDRLGGLLAIIAGLICLLAAVALGIGVAGCGESGKPVAADRDDTGSLIVLSLEDVVSTEDGSPAALLRTGDGDRLLIPVNHCQAVNLYIELYDPGFPRPMTPRLFASLADSLGFAIGHVRLDLAHGDTLTAFIHLERSRPLPGIPATPGDALAIAEYRSASIAATSAVVDQYVEADTTAKVGGADPDWGEVPTEHRPVSAKRSQVGPGLTDMRVVEVAETLFSGFVIVLVDAGQEVVLPVFVDPCQGLAVHAGLHHVDSFANQTQLLIIRLLEAAGADIADVHVVGAVDGVFLAEIGLQYGGRRMAVDCRPSDGIALALLTDAPVRMVTYLLDMYGEDPALYVDLLGSP